MQQRDQQDTGPFGRGGNRPVSLRIEFFGTLGPAFLTFATARAERLDLRGWIIDEGNRVVAHVEGPEALVGAFEMACCIGPDQADVQDWSCSTADPDPDPGIAAFELRGQH